MSEKKGITGFEATKEHPAKANETESTPGQFWGGSAQPSEENQPGQSGRDSVAAGGQPGTLGNLPPSQDRPFTPVGKHEDSRNPNTKI